MKHTFNKILDNQKRKVRFESADQTAPQPSAGIIGAQAHLPKHLDWSDWHRDREDIVLAQMEEREATVSKRNRSHFNYSFIGNFNR